MKISEVFPQKLALKGNFCNREEEKKRLKNNIEGVRPTLIMSPRRYGKTSLVIEVVEKNQLLYTQLDLFPLATEEDVESAILGGIGEILANIESNAQKAFKSVTTFFAELNLGFKLINNKVEVDFQRSYKKESVTLLSAFRKLDEALKRKNKQAIFFLDEFQRLSQMKGSETIEGAIRSIAQRSEYIVFIFSGSNRHLLMGMFDDRTRPLYKLCDRVILDRIKENEYVKFIQNIAKKTKKAPLSIEVLEMIFSITERHPYYLNVLCSRIWRLEGAVSENDVKNCWHNYCLEEKSTVFNELEALSANQLKLLIILARHKEVTSPASDEFLLLSKMASSSLNQALKILLEKDYIYRDNDNVYHVLDPLIKYVLLERPN